MLVGYFFHFLSRSLVSISRFLWFTSAQYDEVEQNGNILASFESFNSKDLFKTNHTIQIDMCTENYCSKANRGKQKHHVHLTLYQYQLLGYKSRFMFRSVDTRLDLTILSTTTENFSHLFFSSFCIWVVSCFIFLPSTLFYDLLKKYMQKI